MSVNGIERTLLGRRNLAGISFERSVMLDALKKFHERRVQIFGRKAETFQLPFNVASIGRNAIYGNIWIFGHLRVPEEGEFRCCDGKSCQDFWVEGSVRLLEHVDFAILGSNFRDREINSQCFGPQVLNVEFCGMQR
jgi:hypothetical protein